jgi:ubiquinone/menaquinone biosynthesis C-methylase UbiE
MYNFRAIIKNIFYKTKLVKVLDHLLYNLARLQNKRRNSEFRKANPGLIIPPDYFLYETYNLNYRNFFASGEYSAKQIMELTEPYRKPGTIKILDWGCGVSRVAVHLHKFTDQPALLYACDINEQMISFNKKSYKDISYSVVTYDPHSEYENEYFDLIYGISIFTHLDAMVQQAWLCEIYRILKKNGIFLFTTHGSFFYKKLLGSEKKALDTNGVFTKSYNKKGHRMMSTYNSAEAFRKIVEKYFTVLDFYDGEMNKDKTGRQDVWIVRK